jgi:DNA processing protein
MRRSYSGAPPAPLPGLAVSPQLGEGSAVDAPDYIIREHFERLRGEREFVWAGPGLWASGCPEALARPTVAIVGTRAATRYGCRQAHRIAADLGSAGCCIVSGLALGIDAAAHEGALSAGAPTIGVLGGGHRRFFPYRNLDLAARMVASGGAALSPFEPDDEARPWQFLARNEIVAALADAVVVVEAPARSGALNTAGWAAGRIPVLAVPGDVDRKHVAGCHALIRDGATLARNAVDVLEALHLRAIPRAPAIERDGSAGALLRALIAGEADLDALVAETSLSPAEALAELAMLELEGLIERRGGNRFARLV